MECEQHAPEPVSDFRAAGVLPIALIGNTPVALIGGEAVYKSDGSKVVMGRCPFWVA